MRFAIFENRKVVKGRQGGVPSFWILAKCQFELWRSQSNRDHHSPPQSTIEILFCIIAANARYVCAEAQNNSPNVKGQEASRSALQLTAIGDHHRLRSCARLRTHFLNLLDDVVTFNGSPEDNVLSIQVRCLASADEELGTIGIGSCICHRQAAIASVLPCLSSKALVSKLCPIDGFATGAVATGEIATLLR